MAVISQIESIMGGQVGGVGSAGRWEEWVVRAGGDW